MPDAQDSTSGSADRILTGQSNWIRWYPGIKADARADDTWALLAGTEVILVKPLRADYVTRREAPVVVTAEKVTGPETARQDFEYRQNREWYQMDLHDYEQQHERVRRANKMLHDRIDPSMQPDIQDIEGPAEALARLQSLYKMQDSRAIQFTHNQIDALRLASCKSMTEYLNKMRQLKNDLVDLGEPYTDSQLIAKIISGLPTQYNSWVERYHDIMADPDAKNPTVKSIEAQLIAKEATLPKTTATNNSNRNKDKDKHGDISKRADGTIRDKCTYEPCGKWGHKEEVCFMKDPSKRDQQKKVKSGSGGTATTTESGKPAKPNAMAAVASVDTDTFENQLAKAKEGWTLVTHGKKGTSTSTASKSKNGTIKTETDSDGTPTNIYDVEIADSYYDNGGVTDVCDTSKSHPSPAPCTPADAPSQTSEGAGQGSSGNHGGGSEGSGTGFSKDCHNSVDDDSVDALKLHFREMNDETLIAAVATKDVRYSRDTWLLDSGCNTYVCNDPAWFLVLHEMDMKITTADNTAGLDIKGGGTVKLRLLDGDGDAFELTLTKVAFAPGARANLISLSKLGAAGLKGVWDDKAITIATSQGHHIGTANARNGLYHLALAGTAVNTAVQLPLASLTDLEDAVWTWHRRLGHLSLERLRKLLKMSTGIDITEEQIKKKLGAVCPVCATSRAIVRIPREPATRRAEGFGDLFHADSWGPYSIKGYDGTTRFVFVTDDASRRLFPLRITTPSDAPDALKQCTKVLQKKFGVTVRSWRVDNEFSKGPFKAWCEKKGMTVEATAPYAHHQVGVAERRNRVIREGAAAMINDNTISGQLACIVVGKADTMMRNTNLPADLWPEAVDHSAWLANRTPTRALKDKTSWEFTEKAKPDLTKEKIWGSRVYVTITEEERQHGPKLHTDRAWLGYFVGMDNESTYRVYEPKTHQVRRVAYAKIDEREGQEDRFERPNMDDQVPLLDGGEVASEDDDSGHSDSDTDHPEHIANMAVGDEEDFGSDFELDEELGNLLEDAERPQVARSGGDDVDDEEDADSEMTMNSPYFKKQSSKRLPRGFWDDKRDDIIRLHHEGKTPGQIAAEFKASAESIYPTIRKLGLSKARKPRTAWTDEMWQKALALKNQGRRFADIATELGLDLKVVQAKIANMLDSDRHWSDTEVHDLRNLRQKGYTALEMSLRIGRSARGIERKCQSLGIHLRDKPRKAKCTACRNRKLVCSGHEDGPCDNCINHGMAQCVWRSEDSSDRLIYVIRDSHIGRDSYDPEDDRCRPCRATGRACYRPNPIGPCYQCMDEETACCTLFPAPGIMKRYDTRFFAMTVEGLESCVIERDNSVTADMLTRNKKTGELIVRKRGIQHDRVFRGYVSDDESKESSEDEDPYDGYETLPAGVSAESKVRIQSFAHQSIHTIDGIPVDPALRQANLAELDIADGDWFIDAEPVGEGLTAMSAFAAVVDLAHAPVPQSRKEALAGPEAIEWSAAIQAEYNSLIANGTWTPAVLPSGRKALTVKWLLKRKLAPDGSITRYKARLVARGFQQVQGFDFTETYSGVVKDVSSRILFAIAASLGWHVHQMDVETAFLNSELYEEIFIYAPEGYWSQGKILKLLKAIYGLKQSPRVWYKKLRAWLLSHGWESLLQDECVFISVERCLVITVYVDDINIFGPHLHRVEEFKAEISQAFKMTDEGPASWYLGMQIEQSERGIFLQQGAYARQIINKHGFQSAAPTATPLDVNKKLVRGEHVASDAEKREYLSKTGSANWLAVKTRPDLSFPTAYVSRFNSNPGADHNDAVSQIFRNILDDPDKGILYFRDGSLLAQGYVDSDWAGDKDTSKSTTGFVFTLAGGPISWSSQRQKSVATSSTHAEYVAASEAAKEAYWIRSFMNEIGRLDDRILQKAVPLHIDNLSAVKLTKNPEAHARTRHIDIRYHYIREQVENGVIEPIWIPGKENPADMFTKPLSSPVLQRICDSINITSTPMLMKANSTPTA